MSSQFSLEFLQNKIGSEYIEINPVTGKPRIIQGLNEVWCAIDESGGIQTVAERFGLPVAYVWEWVDEHYIPEFFALRLVGDVGTVIEIQIPSLGYDDPETGACWPWTWRMTAIELGALQNAGQGLQDQLTTPHHLLPHQPVY